jgi:hypothetical protein
MEHTFTTTEDPMFTLSIRTNNAAFGDQPEYELARILAELATRVGEGATEGTIRDESGNTVGAFRLTEHAVKKGGRR